MSATPEEWLAVPGFEWLEVSSHGRARSWSPHGSLSPERRRSKRPRMLKGLTCPLGYTRVGGPGRTRHLLHRLVALAFHGPSDFEVVRHLDGNPRNNVPSNLAWGSATENARDKALHGTLLMGVDHPQAKLDDDAVRAIRAPSDESITGVARRFGVSRRLIRLIRDGKVWRHVS